MSPYLFDTDTLSEIIRPPLRRSHLLASRLQTYLRSKQVISFSEFSFSEFSVYEILRGFRQKQAQTLEANFRVFCQQCRLCPITLAVLEKAAELWAEGRLQGKVVGDNDLIIAATAE